MTWREELRRVTLSDGRRLIGATFRGVAFFVESVERSGGRRAVVHEFPLRDDPFLEDLGRAARGYRVDGYVIGDDYLSQRDALLAAIEGATGPGMLALPGYDGLSVIAVRYSVREAQNAGGMAVFALEFAETPAQSPAPTEVVDSVEQVSSSADAALVSTNAEFADEYDADGLPAFALESAETALVNASEGLEAELAPIVTESQELAVFTGRIALLTAQAAALIREPATVLEDFRAAIVGLEKTAAAIPGALMEALIDAYAVDLGATVTATTATRTRENANQTAIMAGLRRVIAIEAARLSPRVPYVSIEDALAARTAIAEMLEEQEAIAGDTAYPGLVALRAEVARAVPGEAHLASVVTVSRNTPVSSLILAYQLYGNVDSEPDVVARNSINHPGFVSGDLKVLSDG